MLKISESIVSITQLGEGKSWFGDDNRARCNRRCKLDKSEISDGEIGGGEIEDNEVKKKGQTICKSKNTIKSEFFILRARLMFIELRQVFVKAPIFHYFNLKCYIWIETDISGYAIDEVLS